MSLETDVIVEKSRNLWKQISDEESDKSGHLGARHGSGMRSDLALCTPGCRATS
jgi:hypothetical protein